MTSKSVKKSAFDWIRANVTSLPPSPFALQPEPQTVAPAPPEEKVPARQQAPEQPARFKALPAAVEVWLELVSRADRRLPGWAALARSEDRRGIVIALNAANRLVAKALQQPDQETLAFLVALPLAETLIRRRREPFVAAALERICDVLAPAGKREVSGWLFLSELLAASPELKAVAERLGDGAVTEPQLVLNVRLDAAGEPKP